MGNRSMADRPILFSAPMVRALLDGTKTQTRRVAKITAIMGNRVPVYPPEELIELEAGEFRQGVMHYLSTGALSGPYDIGFAVGDRLWVREAWRVGQCYDRRLSNTHVPVAYEATPREHQPSGRLRPSIFMPRWASRLTLTVTDVRVERLQDISEEDALAEGIDRIRFPEVGEWGWPQRKYAELWNSINGPGAWEANPWVVAISFTVGRHNIDAGALTDA
jgi:hypothetical protein